MQSPNSISVLYVCILVALVVSACGVAPTASERPTSPSVLGTKSVQVFCDGSPTGSTDREIGAIRDALEACTGVINIRYDGPIDSDTVELLRAIPRAESRELLFLNLNSNGGAVDQAMESGRLAWDKAVVVTVDSDSQCLSACVFVVAGARVRSLDGEIGIHRVFTPDPAIRTSADLRLATAAFESAATEYLQEFGVSAGLVTMMMSTPSSSMRYLSSDELGQLGLSNLNVAHRELMRLDLLRLCGREYEDRARAAELEWNRRCPADVEATRSGQVDIVSEEMRRLSECKVEVEREFRVGDPSECR